MTHSIHFPEVLQRFRRLPGPCGSLDVKAVSPHLLELQLVHEYVGLSRDDAQELSRVITEWLAAPAATTTVINEGHGTVVVIDADGAPGTAGVTVEQRPAPQPHYDPGGTPPRRPFF